jgi:uncharacterized protein YfiM (DUF2279 family)
LGPKLLLSTLFFTSLLQSENLSLTTDKKKHFGISFVLGMASYTYVEHKHKTNYTKQEKILLSTSIAVVPGILKEVIDSKEKGNKFDKTDLLYDVIGAFTGSLLSAYVHDSIRINPKEKYLSYTLKF